MKRSKRIIISMILIIVIMVIAFVYLNWNKKNVVLIPSKDFIKANLKDTEEITDNIIYSNYSELEEDFSSSITENEFINNHYLLIPILDGCTKEEITPTDYKIKNREVSITIKYKAICGGCAPSYEYYLLPIPKELKQPTVEINYQAVNKVHCDPTIAYKPIIYLYPEEPIDVKVKLKNKELLTTTYPKYQNSWNVTAYPDGTLKDNNNREYYGLFWEGKNHSINIHEEGFIVEGQDMLTFLEEKLSLLGLTEKEANEFIIYWLPKLENNKYNYIYFETNEEIEQYMPLEVTPTPDSIIRIQMDVISLKEKINIKEQKISTPQREGFTVVEWGGSIIEQ